jgi:hypothetical protein
VTTVSASEERLQPATRGAPTIQPASLQKPLVMPHTVDASFDRFHEAINLVGDYRNTAKARRERVVSLLSRRFEVEDAFVTGSIPRLTALRGETALDVMVVLHYSRHIQDRTPTQVLDSIRDALAAYRTATRRNGQAVTLYFENWPNVAIVPVSRTLQADGTVSHYNVPDSASDTWIPSRPQRLATAIDAKAAECGPNFRRIVQLIKHWNRTQGDCLASYHIEVLALHVCNGRLDSLPWHVHEFFHEGRRLLEGPLWYDTGYVDDYLGRAERLEVRRRFDVAIGRSRDAWFRTYAPNADHRGAIELWRKVFGDAFPAYG